MDIWKTGGLFMSSYVNFELVRNIATIIGVGVAALTLVKCVFEYARQGAQKRAEHFLEMRRRLKEPGKYERICTFLEDDKQELADVPYIDKRDFLGFFEEIALMMNSGLIRKEVAHYMFGYYAIRCFESSYFWSNVEKNSIWWSLFINFASEMKRIEDSFTFSQKKFRF
jgi:hypothetical protein